MSFEQKGCLLLTNHVQLTLNQQWFNRWLGVVQATSHYLNQCWPKSMMVYGITRSQCVNPLHAKFFRRNKNIYLHFMSFLHIDMTQVVEILPQVRQGPTYSTESVSWVLMSWWRKEPGHQQPWYWPSETELTRSPHINGYNSVDSSHWQQNCQSQIRIRCLFDGQNTNMFIHLSINKMDAILWIPFWNVFSWMYRILIKISLKFVPEGLIDDESTLVQVMMITWTNVDHMASPGPNESKWVSE